LGPVLGVFYQTHLVTLNGSNRNMEARPHVAASRCVVKSHRCRCETPDDAKNEARLKRKKKKKRKEKKRVFFLFANKKEIEEKFLSGP
jgi:hypothetical protein